MTQNPENLERAFHNCLNAVRALHPETHSHLWVQAVLPLRLLLGRMVPDAKTFRRILSAQDPALLQLLFETQGAEPYLQIQAREPARFTFAQHAEEGRHDLLQLLRDIGFETPSCPHQDLLNSPAGHIPSLTDLNRALSELAHAMTNLESTDPLRAALMKAVLTTIDAGTRFEASAEAALLVKDAALLAEVIGRFPGSDWHHASRRKLKISALAAENRADLIALLYREGVPIKSDAHHMINEALLRDDPAMLDFLRTEAGYRPSFWKAHNFNLKMRHAKPGTAAHLWQDFLSHLENPHHKAIRSFFSFKIENCRWKDLAVFLCAGRDVTRHIRGWEALPEVISTMVDMTTSHHGRLRLHGLEPDPIAVLTRSPDATFFGLEAGEVEARLKPEA